MYKSSFLAILIFLLGLPLSAQETASTNATPAPRALPVNSGDPNALAPTAGHGVTVHWYGHGFVYLTSSVGVRAAIDPFGSQTVSYKFPLRLSADFVLISHESEDHSATDLLFGNKLIFHSITAVGLNRANGIEFHGTALQVPKHSNAGQNTAFRLKFDGVTFGYLGRMLAPLLQKEIDDIGRVDVLFLPVGLTSVSVKDLNEAALALNARVIIPIEYKTDYTGDLPLRTLDEYLAGTQFPVRKFPTEEVVLAPESLPNQTTVYCLALPSQATTPGTPTSLSP